MQRTFKDADGVPRTDLGWLRPWVSEEDGTSWVTVADEVGTKNVLQKKPALLTQKEWFDIDAAVSRAFGHRTPLTRYLTRLNSFSLNRLDMPEIEYEVMKDAGEEGGAGIPTAQLRVTPLPITHADCRIDPKELARSRNFTSRFEACGRRVGEAIEKAALGLPVECDSQPYGLLNFPSVVGKYPLTGDPLRDVEGMIAVVAAKKYWGPFLLLHNREGVDDFAVSKLERLLETPDLESGEDGAKSGYRYSLLPKGSMLLAQMTPDVIRMIVAQNPITVQWEDGTYKVLAIIVPQIRSDSCGNTGIVVGV
jgi:hypothetical protein